MTDAAPGIVPGSGAPTGSPRPAATVAILRDAPSGPEVLLTHRPATMAFGPGLHVFPGGRVDAEDHDAALLARLRPPLSGDPAGLHGAPFVIAAIREAWEEAGVLLASGSGAAAGPVPRHPSIFRDLVLAHDLELRGDWLAPLSRWVTPPVVPLRYDARFFVAWLPEGATPAFDPREVAGHDWLTPGAALEAMAAGRIELWMPTSTTLQQLDGVLALDDAQRAGPTGPPGAPVTEDVPGSMGLVTRITSGCAGGIPGRDAHTYLVGRSRVVVVDPGDPSDEAADAILGLVASRGATIGAVLVTAPQPDRAAGAEGMALRAHVPLLAPAGARRVLAAHVTAVAAGDLVDVADVTIEVVRPGADPRTAGLGEDAAVAYAVPDAMVVIPGGPKTGRR